MITKREADYEKITQALNLLAQLEGGGINKMKALKLIWLADRYHLRKYGRPLIEDRYFAMKNGPVPSLAKDIAQFHANLSKTVLKYIKKYLKVSSDKYTLYSVSDADTDVFSQTDMEALKLMYKKFGKMDGFHLADYSHDYPEWKKFEEDILVNKMRSVSMDHQEFFKNNRKTDEVFDLPAHHLKASKEVFREQERVAELLA